MTSFIVVKSSMAAMVQTEGGRVWCCGSTDAICSDTAGVRRRRERNCSSVGVIQWAQRLGWGEIWHRKELAQEQMQSWRLRGIKGKKMVCAQGKKNGSEYQMLWTLDWAG
jgi:hypothetical protein